MAPGFVADHRTEVIFAAGYLNSMNRIGELMSAARRMFSLDNTNEAMQIDLIRNVVHLGNLLGGALGVRPTGPPILGAAVSGNFISSWK